MKLIYLSNYFNHHQRPLSEEFYKLLGEGNYYFVETEGVPEFRKKLGYREISAPYVVKYNVSTALKIQEMINNADVVICGEAPSSMVSDRYSSGKLTFRDDECRYRTVSRYIKWPIYTWHSFRWNKGYLLCASAFSCRDYYVSGMKVSKCFKWGYFPEVKVYEDINNLIDSKDVNEGRYVSILWVGRLIGLKHPEIPIKLAKLLKDSGVRFKLEIIGTGGMQTYLKNMISRFNLIDEVLLLGSKTPEEVRYYMERAQIFLFTSDRNEGWGAVLNESMNSACAVVVSPVIGAAPYLINEGVNGLYFEDRNVDSLYEKVMWLINNPEKRKQMGKAAYETMRDVWCAKNAAKSFLQLVYDLQHIGASSIIDGPCSSSPYLRRDWYGVSKQVNKSHVN